MDNRKERIRIPIATLKFRTPEIIKVFTTPVGNFVGTFVSEDLINTDYYISGVVTAHFTFPILSSDPGFSNWNTVMYSSVTPEEYSDEYKGSGDLIFIQDNTAGIAVVGTQFYGNSSFDNSTPPNVDSGYVPHRYHIAVGDNLELYSGRLVKKNREFGEMWYLNGRWQNNTVDSKVFLSLANSFTCYAVIPNKRIVNKAGDIIDDAYDRPIRLETITPSPKRITIPNIGFGSEGTLVKISSVKFDQSKRFSNSRRGSSGGWSEENEGGGNRIGSTIEESRKFDEESISGGFVRPLTEQNSENKSESKDNIFLEPGLAYTVVDNFGNSIDFRICHGTEMAKYFIEIPFNKQFDLIGIVAGTDKLGQFEIWPRNIYDLGKTIPSISVDTSEDIIDFVNLS